VVLAAACIDDTPTALVEPGLETPVEPQFHETFDPSILIMRSPVRMTSTRNGWLLVSDYHRRVILRVDPATLLADQAFSVDGKPAAVGLWGERIFVGNTTTHTIDVFGARGQWRYSFGAGAVEHPTDLAVARERRLVFVVDGRQGVVKIFDARGNLQYTIKELWKPTGIALDETRQEVLVSDYGNLSYGERASVKIFSYTGTLITTISGKMGMMGNRFSRPQGLAVDGNGHIFVVDALSGEVLVLDRETGATVETLGEFGLDPGQLLMPTDVVIGSRGVVFVTSYKTARIERFLSGAVAPRPRCGFEEDKEFEGDDDEFEEEDLHEKSDDDDDEFEEEDSDEESDDDCDEHEGSVTPRRLRHRR